MKRAGKFDVAGFKAFLFDMDGVLADNCGYHVVAWLEFAKRHGFELTEKQVIDWMGAPGSYYVERMLGRKPSPAELMRLAEEKEAVYREIYAPHAKLPAGLRALLDGAHAHGVPCAVVTGGPLSNVDFLMDALALRGDFAFVVDASQYERGKPAPDCYLQGAARLGVAPADCLVFEDAVNGIQAGRAAGMRVVAITGTNPRAVLEAAEADCVIDSFTELLIGE